jgi:hypothetical protein
MELNCVRCGRSAFATLKLEAAIGTTRLKIADCSAETGICATCVIGLADWLMVERDGNGLRPMKSRVMSTNRFARPPRGTDSVS